jgi:hypothetical protein
MGRELLGLGCRFQEGSLMALPYENSTSGANAITDIRKSLQAFGCTKFASGEDFDTGELFIQFEHHGRKINLRASARGYAAAWLKAHPYSTRVRASRAQHEARALQVGSVAVYSILRDWVKGQVTAVEIGMMTFEAAFLSHMLLPSGLSVIEHVEAEKLLPPPQEAG